MTAVAIALAGTVGQARERGIEVEGRLAAFIVTASRKKTILAVAPAGCPL